MGERKKSNRKEVAYCSVGITAGMKEFRLSEDDEGSYCLEHSFDSLIRSKYII